ncbi:MAG: acyl-CoA dehydrogenase family protein [Actinobacteria bacterium]|nr:acyl-CoA dehydrogenase family protein [Actinomycetota bacterium]
MRHAELPPDLSEEERELLLTVRRFADDEIAPRAADGEAAERFPRDVFDELGQLGLMGLPFPEDVGGGALPYRTYLLVVEELATAWLTVGLGLSVHTLSTWGVEHHATDDQRARFIPPMTAGDRLGAYSLSEPDSGSDAASLSTRAVRDGDVYRLDGTKAWVTHAGEADRYLVMARTGDDGARGISAFVVDRDQEGLSFPPPEDKMGMRASTTGQLRFEDAPVPADRLVGEEEGTGFRIAMASLDGGRLGIAAASVGVAQAALGHAVSYATQREQFGRPVIGFQGVSFLLADMATGIEAARALYLDTAARRDAGEDTSRQAAMSKLFASDVAMRVATDAVQVHGGYGYTREYPVERLMREAKVLQIVEGTNQIQRMVIGRKLAGT